MAATSRPASRMLASSGCSESLGVHGHGSSGQSAAAAALPTSSSKTSSHTRPARPGLSSLRARSVRLETHALETHAHACQALASSGCGTAAGAAERTRLP